MYSIKKTEKQMIAKYQQLEEEKFWLRELAGEIQKKHFPYDNKNDLVKGYSWDQVEIKIDFELSAKLLQVSKQSDYALHVILVSGLFFLLYKYLYNNNVNYDKDIIIGSPIYHQEIEGEFINKLLPFRMHMRDNLLFKDLLFKVKQIVLQAVKNQNYPIDLLIEQLDLPSIPNNEEDYPLFDNIILLENIHDQKYLSGYKFNAIFSFLRTNKNISGWLKYNAQCFKRTTMEEIARHYASWLKTCLFNKNLEIRNIEILTYNEKKQILETFNNTDMEYPNHKTLHQIFIEQAYKTPDKVAILSYSNKGYNKNNSLDSLNKEYITFKELNEKSDRFARLLLDRGIKINTIVPLITERSLEMIYGILAILKSGGAYLPIERDCPDYRKNFILRDCNSSILLTTKYIYDNLIEHNDHRFIKYEMLLLDSKINNQVNKNFNIGKQSANNMAYVIYTSGSTGIPKGVLIDHYGVVNYALWRIKSYKITHRDITLQLLSHMFDGFCSNFYSSLLSGGLLVVIPESMKVDFSFIKIIIKKELVTNMSLVPGIYEAMLDIFTSEDVKHLRFTELGGEKPTKSLIKRSVKMNPKMKIMNEYGPTETTIAVTANIGIFPEENAVIGKPISNNQIYILDPTLKLRPRYLIGELYISGVGVSRGYLNNPELTAEKYIKNPFSDKKKNYLLYRTCDLGRWLFNGKIEFFGRIDEQVKIRGFRVELGEIENCLSQNKEIDESMVVINNNNGEQNSELIAFYKFKNNIKNNSESIQKFLRDRLPEYMVPSQLIELNEFPLTSNGKIDKKALLKLAHSDKKIIGNNFTPRNSIEKRITEVWKKVLGLDKISMDSPFFDIGGTSLKAVNVIMDLTEELDITIDHIYQFHSIGEIAKNVSRKEKSMKEWIAEAKEELKKDKSKDVKRRKPKTKEKQTDPAYIEYKEQVQKENLELLEFENDYNQILITGGTGFLGAHLIFEIMSITKADIHLLIRGNDSFEAENRLKMKLNFYFGKNFYQKNKNRLHIFPGDIRNEKFGVNEYDYQKLSETVNTIIHTAADVRNFGIYEEFYRTNVVGTENLLDFAINIKKKDFFYISTIGIGQGEIQGERNKIFTEFCHDVGQILNNVYIKSKFEAEKEVLAFRKRGLNTSIFRVGNLIGHSKTGKFQQNIESNGFYAQMRAFIKMKVVPFIPEWYFDMSFIDYTATAIVKLISRKFFKNEIYHLYNPYQMNWVTLSNLLTKAGNKLDVVEIVEFLNHLSRSLDSDDLENERLISRLLLHTGAFTKPSENTGSSKITKIYQDRTLRILEQLDFKWAMPKKTHIKRIIKHCADVGYL